MEQLQSSPAFDALRHRRSATIDKTMPSVDFSQLNIDYAQLAAHRKVDKAVTDEALFTQIASTFQPTIPTNHPFNSTNRPFNSVIQPTNSMFRPLSAPPLITSNHQPSSSLFTEIHARVNNDSASAAIIAPLNTIAPTESSNSAPTAASTNLDQRFAQLAEQLNLIQQQQQQFASQNDSLQKQLDAQQIHITQLDEHCVKRTESQTLHQTAMATQLQNFMTQQSAVQKQQSDIQNQMLELLTKRSASIEASKPSTPVAINITTSSANPNLLNQNKPVINRNNRENPSPSNPITNNTDQPILTHSTCNHQPISIDCYQDSNHNNSYQSINRRLDQLYHLQTTSHQTIASMEAALATIRNKDRQPISKVILSNAPIISAFEPSSDAMSMDRNSQQFSHLDQINTTSCHRATNADHLVCIFGTSPHHQQPTRFVCTSCCSKLCCNGHRCYTETYNQSQHHNNNISSHSTLLSQQQSTTNINQTNQTTNNRNQTSHHAHNTNDHITNQLSTQTLSNDHNDLTQINNPTLLNNHHHTYQSSILLCNQQQCTKTNTNQTLSKDHNTINQVHHPDRACTTMIKSHPFHNHASQSSSHSSPNASRLGASSRDALLPVPSIHHSSPIDLRMTDAAEAIVNNPFDIASVSSLSTYYGDNLCSAHVPSGDTCDSVCANRDADIDTTIHINATSTHNTSDTTIKRSCLLPRHASLSRWTIPEQPYTIHNQFALHSDSSPSNHYNQQPLIHQVRTDSQLCYSIVNHSPDVAKSTDQFSVFVASSHALSSTDTTADQFTDDDNPSMNNIIHRRTSVCTSSDHSVDATNHTFLVPSLTDHQQSISCGDVLSDNNVHLDRVPLNQNLWTPLPQHEIINDRDCYLPTADSSSADVLETSRSEPTTKQLIARFDQLADQISRVEQQLYALQQDFSSFRQQLWIEQQQSQTEASTPTSIDFENTTIVPNLSNNTSRSFFDDPPAVTVNEQAKI
jgi:phage shock protein A